MTPVCPLLRNFSGSYVQELSWHLTGWTQCPAGRLGCHPLAQREEGGWHGHLAAWQTACLYVRFTACELIIQTWAGFVLLAQSLTISFCPWGVACPLSRSQHCPLLHNAWQMCLFLLPSRSQQTFALPAPGQRMLFVSSTCHTPPSAVGSE